MLHASIRAASSAVSCVDVNNILSGSLLYCCHFVTIVLGTDLASFRKPFLKPCQHRRNQRHNERQVHGCQMLWWKVFQRCHAGIALCHSSMLKGLRCMPQRRHNVPATKLFLNRFEFSACATMLHVLPTPYAACPTTVWIVQIAKTQRAW